MTIEGLAIEYLSGLCPVQAEGTMDGFPFYFRARHTGWSLTVAAPGQEPVDVWINAHIDGGEIGVHHVAELFDDAGYMDLGVARDFIEREYEVVCKKLSQPAAAA
jgi:hypothetical protein